MSSSPCLNYFSRAVSNFQAFIAAGILPLDYFLLLKLGSAKSEHKNKDFIFNSCDDLKFPIWLFTVFFAKLKTKHLQCNKIRRDLRECLKQIWSAP